MRRLTLRQFVTLAPYVDPLASLGLVLGEPKKSKPSDSPKHIGLPPEMRAILDAGESIHG